MIRALLLRAAPIPDFACSVPSACQEYRGGSGTWSSTARQ